MSAHCHCGILRKLWSSVHEPACQLLAWRGRNTAIRCVGSVGTIWIRVKSVHHRPGLGMLYGNRLSFT